MSYVGCFPVGVRPARGSYHEKPMRSTIVVDTYNGGDQTRQMWPTGGKLGVDFQTEPLLSSGSRWQVLRDFLLSIEGRASQLDYFLADPAAPYLRELIGTTSGSAGQVVPLAFRQSSVSQVYVDGVSLAGAFTFTPNIGTNGEDEVTITAAQTSAKPITADVIGRKRYRMKSLIDSLDFASWKGSYVSVPISLRQV